MTLFYSTVTTSILNYYDYNFCYSIVTGVSRMVGSYCHMFSVQCDTEGGEMVAVTGSSPDLGQWRRSSVIPMVRTSEHR